MKWTVWGDKVPHTLFGGEGPPKFVNGDVLPDCYQLFAEFDAPDLETAEMVYERIRSEYEQ